MTPENPSERNEPRTNAPTEDRDAPERGAAPPIEREHETYAGVLEEDERREKEKQREEEDVQGERR